MGASQGAEQQAGARESVGLSAIATFVTAPLDEQARLGVLVFRFFFFFSHSLFPSWAPNRSSPLIYHTEELNVDTSKYFRTQRSPGGATVFSLFKMERANPSPAVCDKRKKQKNIKKQSICARVTFARVFALFAHVRVRMCVRGRFVHVRCTEVISEAE